MRLSLSPAAALAAALACWCGSSSGRAHGTADVKKPLNVLVSSVPLSPIHSVIEIGAELAERGHHVSVMSLESARRKVEKRGLKFIDLGVGPSEADYSERVRAASAKNNTGIANNLKVIGPLFNQLNDAMTNGTKRVFPIVEEGQPKPEGLPDIVVASIGSGYLFKVCVRYGIPYVVSHPTFAIAPVFTSMPYVPFMQSNLPLHDANMWQRLLKLVVAAIFNFILPITGYPIKAVDPEMTRRTMKMIHSVPGMDWPFHAPPLLQYTGAILRPETLSPANLEPPVKEWLDRSDLPVVYVSLGTVFEVDAELARTMIRGLSPLPGQQPQWRILWALPKNQWDLLPPEGQRPAADLLHIETWVTTPAALSHEKVKVFLSHCGGNGVHESIWTGTPIVGMPFAGDQLDVCRRVAAFGAGVYVDRFTVDSATLHRNIAEVLTQPSYTFRVQRMSAIMKTYGGVKRAAGRRGG